MQHQILRFLPIAALLVLTSCFKQYKGRDRIAHRDRAQHRWLQLRLSHNRSGSGGVQA